MKVVWFWTGVKSKSPNFIIINPKHLWTLPWKVRFRWLEWALLWGCMELRNPRSDLRTLRNLCRALRINHNEKCTSPWWEHRLQTWYKFSQEIISSWAPHGPKDDVKCNLSLQNEVKFWPREGKKRFLCVMNEYIQKQRLLEQLQMGQLGWKKRSRWDGARTMVNSEKMAVDSGVTDMSALCGT